MKSTFSVILLLISTFYVKSETPTLIFNGEFSGIEGKYISVYEDQESNLEIKDVLKINEDFFKPQKLTVPNLMLSKSVFWAKFNIKNTTPENTLLIEFDYPIIKEADLFSIDGYGKISVQESGAKIPISKRQYQNAGFIYEVNIPQNTSKTFYLKIKNDQQIMLPLKIGYKKQVFDSLMDKNTFMSIYMGIIMVMFFYNMFLFVATKDKSYLLYSIYIVLLGLTHVCVHGYTYKLLWPSSPLLAEWSVALSPALVGIASILFLRSFLRTKIYAKKIHRFYNLLVLIYLAGIVIYFTGLPQLSYKLLQNTVVILAITIMYTSVVIIKKGYRPAKYFMISWSIFITCVVIFILKDFGILPYNRFTIHSIEIGATIELVLISFALADRINILKKEKQDAQQREMDLLQENKLIVEEQNVILESKVKDRTEALQQSNEYLSKAITDLKQAQSQLVDAEKMASLGQLTAGIAHEINNPINFVVSNIKPLKRDISDILEVLNEYANIKPGDSVEEKLKEIELLKENLDLDFTLNEIDELLKGIDEGAGRTIEIVKSLRTFSRLDENDLKKADINECIESTLLLLKNSINENIEIDKSFCCSSTIVECYPGKMNQLFMNILNNAIQAIESKTYSENEKGLISISTEDALDHLVIKIKDNATGMDEVTKNRIFEPFYTTKDVGKGTGLGLSIVYKIVEKHHAEIDVNSQLGKGTEFIIKLPKKQLESSDASPDYKAMRRKKMAEKRKTETENNN